jgi:glycosyltransferase involved in cell wall biosynthesis
MKIALVHDYLNQFGGAERVLLALSEMFPDAPIYTLFYDEALMRGYFSDKKIITSFLDRSMIRKRHRAFIPLFAPAAYTLDLGNKYDLIISDSAGFGKGFRYNKHTPHISYIHSPLRYAWEPEVYLGTLFSKPTIMLGKPLLYALKHWDKYVAQWPTTLLANSHHTLQKMELFYQRTAEVLHPPVNTDIFYPDQTGDVNGYYLAFGRMLHYKRFDLIVDAFNKLNKPLLIIGDGPERNAISARITSPKIDMRPPVRDENELRRIISNARAVLFPQEEDFGLVAAESITCGTPVIAYGRGGALEIVHEGMTGTFFYEQSPERLIEAIRRFETYVLNRNDISESAHIFSKKHFQNKIHETIDLL